jgi:cellulose synthase/poly-beta-1,6-N-acetylglucosamine synthase-like glycosyltransferase
VKNPHNQGKPAAIARLHAAARHELLLFTDASALLQPDALRRLVDGLADPAVGVAAARYVVTGRDAEAGYWSVEARVRRAEAARDMLLGVSGAAYLIRRGLVPTLAPGTINDDWLIPARARLAGHRVAYVPQAVAGDAPTASERGLYRRWVRIAFGNYQMLTWVAPSLGRAPRLWAPALRKLLRTLTPVLLLLTLATAFFEGAAVGRAVGLGAAAACVAAGACFAWPAPPRPARLIRAAVLSQLAYLVGAWRFFRGRAEGIWAREETP